MQIRSSGCIEKRTVNLNTSALLLHSSNSSSSHSGIFYWKSKVYCNQTLSNHGTFFQGVYSQINVILHCSNCSRSRKWLIEPLITVKLSGFPIIPSLEQYYVVQRLRFLSAGAQICSYRAQWGSAQLCWRTRTHACPCKCPVLLLEAVLCVTFAVSLAEAVMGQNLLFGSVQDFAHNLQSHIDSQ